jgi:ribosomal protein S18 acetylase RimI-like enzyme
MDIRPATVANLEAVERLLVDTFSPRAGPHPGNIGPDRRIAARIALRQLNDRPVVGVLVAVDGQTLAGVASVITRDIAAWPGPLWLPALRPLGLRGMLRTLAWATRSYYRPAPHEAYLFAFAVAPAYRRHGIAGKLLQAAEAQARAWDKTLASAFVAHGNAASLGLLRKYGYREVPMPWYRGRRLLRLEKALPPSGIPAAATYESAS